MSSRDTKKLILDAGESLFSRHSYVDVTFRQIAKRAGVHISQITYHFQNKDRLLEQVVSRRATVLNDERMSMLTAYQRVVGREGWQIEPLVRAFFDPYFDKLIQEQNEGWRNYGALIGRIVWDPLALPVFNEAYNEVSKHYLVALTKAAPEIEEELIHRAFQFLLATMYSAGADNRCIDNLSSGKFSSQDFDRIYESIIPFVTGGFMALAKASIVSHVRGDAA
jgi:AcrR family transcriptional regulator